MRRGGAKRREGRLDYLTVLVEHPRKFQMILECVGIFDVADGSRGLRNIAGNPFIALGADPRWPIDRRRSADIALPFSAHAREKCREHEGRARSIRAVDNCDRLVWQFQGWIELPDRGIVPA